MRSRDSRRSTRCSRSHRSAITCASPATSWPGAAGSAPATAPRRRRAALARLASLDSMLALAPIGDHVRLAGNLVASRLWERAGNVRKAYEAARRWTFTNNPVDGSLFATYLREQARLGAAAGDREAAIAAYRQYVRLRANAEPTLAGDLATARAALEKLEQQSAGR